MMVRGIGPIGKKIITSWWKSFVKIMPYTMFCLFLIGLFYASISDSENSFVHDLVLGFCLYLVPSVAITAFLAVVLYLTKRF